MSAVIVQGGGQLNLTVVGNTVNTSEYAVECQGALPGLVLSGNTVQGSLLWADGVAVQGTVANNTSVSSATTAVVEIEFDGPLNLSVRGNYILNPAGHGVHLVAASSGGPEDIEISDNTIQGAGVGGSFTFDDIMVEDGSAFIHGNKLRAGILTRNGVNLDTGSFCCKVVGNDLGDPADYGTDSYVDSGSDNVNTWPADATYGDNFTICPTSP